MRPVLGSQASLPRLLGLGAIVWAAYSVLHVVLYGVVLDDSLVAGQIITRSVEYPAGHPHEVAYTGLYCLTYYVTAALLWLTGDAVLISAFRNFLFLFLSTYVVYAAGAIFTRRALWGHLAAAVMLSEVLTQWAAVYPIWVFPNFYSNGHVGINLALLAIFLLSARCWRTGGFLLGVLPSVHATMALLAWAWAGAYLLFSKNRPARGEWRRLVLAGVPGVVICIGLYFVIQGFAANLTVEPPYDAAGDVELVTTNFRETTDAHRRPLPGGKYLFLTTASAFFITAGLVLFGRRRNERSAAVDPATHWLVLLGAGCWLYVYAVCLLQRLDVGLPEIVQRSMPGRFSNAPDLLLVPLAVAVVARAIERMETRSRTIALAWLVLLVLGQAVLCRIGLKPLTKYGLLAWWGVSLGIAAVPSDRRARIIVAVGMVLLLLMHVPIRNKQYVVPLLAAFVATVGGIWLMERILRRLETALDHWSPRLEVGLAMACIVAVLATAPGPHRADLSRFTLGGQLLNADDAAILAWLERESEPGEVIVPAIYPRSELQVKTGHPSLFELETLWLMTYMPELAPCISMMARDLYGVDYTDRAALDRILFHGFLYIHDPVWLDAWKARTVQEWRLLGEKYDFRLVLAPNRMELPLEVAVAGEFWILYVIPRVDSEG